MTTTTEATEPTTPALSTLLEESRALIADPTRWIKGDFDEVVEYDKDGKEILGFCMRGAVNHALYEHQMDGSLEYHMRRSLNYAATGALTRQIRADNPDYYGVVEFNDDEKTTHDQVLAVFDKTIEHVKKEEQA